MGFSFFAYVNTATLQNFTLQVKPQNDFPWWQTCQNDHLQNRNLRTWGINVWICCKIVTKQNKGQNVCIMRVSSVATQMKCGHKCGFICLLFYKRLKCACFCVWFMWYRSQTVGKACAFVCFWGLKKNVCWWRVTVGKIKLPPGLRTEFIMWRL